MKSAIRNSKVIQILLLKLGSRVIDVRQLKARMNLYLERAVGITSRKLAVRLSIPAIFKDSDESRVNREGLLVGPMLSNRGLKPNKCVF